VFQSTPASEEAGDPSEAAAAFLRTEFQSTPASEEAGDAGRAVANRCDNVFQSTPASEEAGDIASSWQAGRIGVSIHARLRGSGRPASLWCEAADEIVSIHARLRGSGRQSSGH